MLGYGIFSSLALSLTPSDKNSLLWQGTEGFLCSIAKKELRSLGELFTRNLIMPTATLVTLEADPPPVDF